MLFQAHEMANTKYINPKSEMMIIQQTSSSNDNVIPIPENVFFINFQIILYFNLRDVSKKRKRKSLQLPIPIQASNQADLKVIFFYENC